MSRITRLIVLFKLILVSSVIYGQDLTTHFSYSQKADYNERIVKNEVDQNGDKLQKVVIDGFDSRVPFYIITPANKKEQKFILLLHGIESSKDNWLNPINSYAEKYVKIKDALLKGGYTLIIPDAKYHGERSYEADFTYPTSFSGAQDTDKMLSLLTTTVKDIRIIMDYFESKSDNKPLSFDVVGYSMGGINTIMLNAVDDRLNHAIACVAAMDLKKTTMTLGMTEDNAEKLNFLSTKNFAPLQKGKLTLLMGTEDVWYSKEEAQLFYDDLIIKEKKIKYYNSGHLLPDQFIIDVVNFVNED